MKARPPRGAKTNVVPIRATPSPAKDADKTARAQLERVLSSVTFRQVDRLKRFLNFTVQGPRPDRMPGTDAPSLHEPFGDIPEANLFGHQLETEWDGSFVLYIGGPKRESNWLPTTPGSRKLFLRQGFDRWEEESAQYRIERIDIRVDVGED